MQLQDKVILITGAAKRIGSHLARTLARQSAHIIIHYNHSKQAAIDTEFAIKQAGGRASIVQADLTQEQDLLSLFRYIKKKNSKLDILINNASLFQKKPFFDIQFTDWEETFRINLKAPFFLAQFAANMMQANKNPGLILNITDTTALNPIKGYSHHSISKAALVHLTQTLAQELSPHIRINTVLLGHILAPENSSDIKWQELVQKKSLLQRVGSLQEVSAFIESIIKNDYINGATLRIDGGITNL